MFRLFQTIRDMFEKRIVVKVLTVMVFLSILLYSCINIFFISTYSRSLHEMHYELDEEMVRSFALTSADMLMRRDYLALNTNVVRNLQSHKDVLYAKVLNTEGQLLTLASNRLLTERKYCHTISKDIIYRDQKIGVLEVGIDTSGIRQQVHKFSVEMIIAGTVTLLLIILSMMGVLTTLVLKPLLNLNKSVAKITGGDLTLEAQVNTKDEIGDFARNFNFMLKQLRDNIAMTTSVIDSTPSLCVTMDENYRILNCNSKIIDYIENEADLDFSSGHSITMAAKGKSLFALVPSFEKYRTACGNVLKKGKEIRLQREHISENKYLQAFLFPLKNSSFKGLVLRLDDVSEEESKDAQLRQAQKLESLGTLASGLAHDFNNVLSGIVSTVSIMKYRIQSQSGITLEKLENLIDIIETSANRAGDMVQRMLHLSRKQEMHFTTIDLNTCLTHVTKICKNTIDKSVKIEIEHYPEKALTIADPTQIETVLLNLAINGWHAMTWMKKDNPGGVLKMSLDLVTTNKFITNNTAESTGDEFWVLTVSDTGVGISPENQKKVFDPFFSTKEGKGTGLGLSMVFSIIKQHNGFIDLYSEVGVGTKFLIYLPTKSTSDTDLIEDTDTESICWGNGELILLVDDELIMRESASNMLTEANYKVITTDDGKQAIDIYTIRQKDIALAIIDMSMPGLSGPETFHELQKINPNIKAILSSGFTLKENEDEIKATGIKGFIEKPYTLGKLSKVVKDVIMSDTPHC